MRGRFPLRARHRAGGGGGTLQGTLPIVTDQFATVTVVPNAELRRNGAATLGGLLFERPGITGSSFAPGAASRPIIRGLDVNRVRIQEGGIGANGASDLGEDHFVPVDPLIAEQVEVIRGPATLRFGSQAIGGVVETNNNRIPTGIPQHGFSAEFRGGASTGDVGLDGAVLGIVMAPREERPEQHWALRIHARLERSAGIDQTLETLELKSWGPSSLHTSETSGQERWTWHRKVRLAPEGKGSDPTAGSRLN